MADFQSSKTAAEIEEVLTGALLYTVPQPLTEGQKAFVREKIGATELGEGIKIVAHFDTLEELEAVVSKPSAGEAYSIGTELPYNLYVFDFFHNKWENHGPIRASDITARFAQNQTVLTDAWEEDLDVFADYTYKAAIQLAEITGNDFPIVALAPAEAVGGNFCPMCFAFDGYVEIWARAIPETDIIIPEITFIVQDTEGGESGKSTKGITNAGGGIAEGSLVNSMLASESVTADKVKIEARTQYFDVVVDTEWIGDVAPFSQTIAVEGLTADLEVTTALSSDATGDEITTAYNALEHTVTDGMISFKTDLETNIDIPITITFTAVDATETTIVSIVIKASDWVGSAPPYSQTVAVKGLLESDRAKVRFSVPDIFDELEAQQEAFALLYDAESADGFITLYAKELPRMAFSVVLEVARI